MKSNKRIVTGKGQPCPKCSNLMQRRKHPAGWQPREQQQEWFVEWDYCARCRHVQHYEVFKRSRRREPEMVLWLEDVIQ